MENISEQELLEKISAYKIICTDLILENKQLKKKIIEYENQVSSV